MGQPPQNKGKQGATEQLRRLYEYNPYRDTWSSAALNSSSAWTVPPSGRRPWNMLVEEAQHHRIPAKIGANSPRSPHQRKVTPCCPRELTWYGRSSIRWLQLETNMIVKELEKERKKERKKERRKEGRKEVEKNSK